MQVPILSYHSHTIGGRTYEANDHIALHEDLRTISVLGFCVIPLHWVVEWVLGQKEDSLLERCVALTFDDGADADYYDINHPQYGHQTSFFNVLIDFRAEVGVSAQPYLQATSFVIASPEVREAIDRYCLREIGLKGMSDDWWSAAHRSGLLSIQNHSWDHNHPAANQVCQKDQKKGSFTLIDTYAECRGEIQQAAQYIHRRIAPAWPELFAYPWGESSEYLRSTYLPSFPEQHHVTAAFGALGGYVTKSSSRWNIPRFVHGAPEGKGWKTAQQFKELLLGAL